MLSREGLWRGGMRPRHRAVATAPEPRRRETVAQTETAAYPGAAAVVVGSAVGYQMMEAPAPRAVSSPLFDPLTDREKAWVKRWRTPTANAFSPSELP